MAELDATLSGAEFALWEAEYRRAPWGDWPAHLMAATVSATVANVNRRTDSEPFSPVDFIPWADRPEPEETDPESFMELMGKT